MSVRGRQLLDDCNRRRQGFQVFGATGTVAASSAARY